MELLLQESEGTAGGRCLLAIWEMKRLTLPAISRLADRENVPRLCRVRFELPAMLRNWHRTAAQSEAFPSMGFGDSTVLQFGAEEVRVYHAPNAHTDGDAIVWLPRSNIIHLGDIFELDAEPFVDWWAGGTLAGMIAAVDRVLPLIDDHTRVVPGHGPVADRATLVSYRAMLGTMQTRVQAAIAAGTSLEALLGTHPTAEFDARLGGPSHGERLTRLLYVGLGRRRDR